METREITIVKKWIAKVVVGLGFCPFASIPFLNDRIKYVVIDFDTKEGLLKSVAKEFVYLQENKKIDTTLVILKSGLSDFYNYLDGLEMINEFVESSVFYGVFQVASFHPDYTFADSTTADPGDYTNRSPFPVFHLLREAQIENAINQYPNVEDIPTKNIAKCQKLGTMYFENLLKEISRDV